MMQHLGRNYVPYLNSKYGRSGTLWEGRFKASIVDDEAYLLICHRYIEMNPVRAGPVNAPSDYRWSSYHCNAEGQDDRLITPHNFYIGLGNSELNRIAAYKNLFSTFENSAATNNIRASIQSGTPLGSNKFKQNIQSALAIPIGQVKQGRPCEHRKKGSDPFMG